MTTLIAEHTRTPEQEQRFQDWTAWLTQFQGLYARAQRVTAQRGEHIRRLTIELFGHEMYPGLIHNALAGAHHGRPWRYADGTLYNTSHLRLIDRMYGEMFHAHHVVTRWYDRTYPSTVPSGARDRNSCTCSLPGWGNR